MAENEVKIKVGIDNSELEKSIPKFKSSAQEIKYFKNALYDLSKQNKEGGEAWKFYSQKLEQAVKTKQAVQRETKLTSQQLVSLGRDLTIVAMGFQNAVKDVQTFTKDLNEGKKSSFEMGLQAVVLSTQILAIVPSIVAVSRALKVMIASNPYLLITAVAIGTIIEAVRQLTSVMDGVNNKFSLFEGILTQALKLYKLFTGEIKMEDFANLKLAKEGFDDIRRSIESLNVAQNLLNNFKAGENVFDALWNSMKRLVDGIYNLPAGILKFLGIDLSKSEPNAGMDYIGIAKDPEADSGNKVKNGSSNSGGTSKKDKEKDIIDELLKSVKDELDLQKLTGVLNTQSLLDAKNKLELAKNENLTLEQKIKLLTSIEDLQSRITKWLTSGKKISDFQSMSLPETKIKDRYHNPLDLKDLNPNQKDSDINDEIDRLLNMVSDNFQGMVNSTVGMLQNLNLMETGFGQILNGIIQIINIFKSAFDVGSSIFGFITSLISLIPGGGLVSGVLNVVGGASGGGGGSSSGGGGGFSMNSGGMSYNGGGTPNISSMMRGMNNNSSSPNITVIVNSEVEQTKAVRFYQNTLPAFNNRQSKKVL